MNVALKHLGSIGGSLNVSCSHGCFTLVYIFLLNLLACLNVHAGYCLTVVVAFIDDKQVRTYTEWLRKMDALMRRQTTPVR